MHTDRIRQEVEYYLTFFPTHKNSANPGKWFSRDVLGPLFGTDADEFFMTEISDVNLGWHHFINGITPDEQHSLFLHGDILWFVAIWHLVLM
jgi:hypothetical protein